MVPENRRRRLIRMKIKNKKLLITGIIGCLLYVTGDFLFAATLCNPMVMPGVIGNLLTLFPWPVNQLDHGTESFGHALVLILGLVLLKEMSRAGELESAVLL